MDECIEPSKAATVLSTLDADIVYWKVKVDEADRDNIAFTSYRGLHRLEQMPFDLQNALSSFQRAMNVILLAVKWQYALVYHNDIGVFFQSPSNHIARLCQVLTSLEIANITLKLEKCSFFKNAMDYVGHVMQQRTLEIAFYKTDAIKRLNPPTNLAKLGSFPDFYTVFRHFLPSFARMFSGTSEPQTTKRSSN